MNLACTSARVALILFSILCVRTVTPQSPPTSQAPHLPAPRITVIGIPSFAKVSPRIYRGGQPTPASFEKLKKMGVDIVVDLRLSGKDKERERVTKAGMQFVELPWHCMRPRDATFARFLTLLRENPDKKIFVHCRYGDDRTGMMIAAYRMAVQGWTRQEARQEMNKFGFHHSLCAPLVRYENNFMQHLQNGEAFKTWRSESEAFTKP